MKDLISREEALDAIKYVIKNKFDNWSLRQREARYLIEAIASLRPLGVIVDSTKPDIFEYVTKTNEAKERD